MNSSEWISIGFAALTLAAGFLATYYKGSGRLSGAVAGFIAQAEQTYKDAGSGGLKMQYVCGKLYAMLPAAVRPFIPQAVIQTVAQAVFNEIDAYAKAQLDRVLNKAAS